MYSLTYELFVRCMYCVTKKIGRFSGESLNKGLFIMEQKKYKMIETRELCFYRMPYL